MSTHNDFFSILNSSVTVAEIKEAGYSKGITRTRLDSTEYLVQDDVPLPPELDSFVVVKDKTLDEITPTLNGLDWSDITGGI